MVILLLISVCCSAGAQLSHAAGRVQCDLVPCITILNFEILPSFEPLAIITTIRGLTRRSVKAACRTLDLVCLVTDMDRTAFVAFTYGTLLSEKVLLAVLGRVPQRIDAKLSGYARAPIRGQCYPAVFKKDDSSSVNGKLLLGLSEKELMTLDDFEDPAYDRATVEVDTADGKRSNVRLWARPDSHVEDLIREMDWDFERFRTEHEEKYVERCYQWATASASP